MQAIKNLKQNNKTILVCGGVDYLKILEQKNYGIVQNLAKNLSDVMAVSDFCVYNENGESRFDQEWNTLIAKELFVVDKKLSKSYIEDLKTEYLKTVENQDGSIDLNLKIVDTLAALDNLLQEKPEDGDEMV